MSIKGKDFSVVKVNIWTHAQFSKVTYNTKCQKMIKVQIYQ